MNPLQKKLTEVQGKFGQDSFLDVALLEKEVKLHFVITQKDMAPVLWCVNKEVYFKAYADPDPEHMWYFRYILQQQMKQQNLDNEDAREVLDAWMGLANYHKKGEEFKQLWPGAEALFAELYSACRGFEAGMEPEALQKLEALCDKTPLAHYYLGINLLKAIQPNAQKAVEQLQLGAKAKNRDCIYELGNCMHAGRGVEQSDAGAIEQYLHAAQLLHPHALFLVGVLYAEGYAAVEKNPIRSLYYLSWAARQGHKEARYFLAIYYKQEHDNGQVTNAHPFFTEETVDMSEAFYKIAQIYETGSCFVKNEERALQHYRNARAYGNRLAEKLLRQRYQQDGRVDEQGEVADEDKTGLNRVDHWKARADMQTAATAGNAEAQYGMGLSYLENTPGHEANPTVALSWFRRGAAQGHEGCEKMIPVSNYLIGMTFVTPATGQHSVGPKAAKGIPFWLRALDHAEDLDENMKCDCYHQIAVASCESLQDFEQTELYMAYPLGKGYLKAHVYMARVYMMGIGVPVDCEKAFGYFLSADKISPANAHPALENAYANITEKGEKEALSEALREEIERVLAQPV